MSRRCLSDWKWKGVTAHRIWSFERSGLERHSQHFPDLDIKSQQVGQGHPVKEGKLGVALFTQRKDHELETEWLLN